MFWGYYFDCVSYENRWQVIHPSTTHQPVARTHYYILYGMQFFKFVWNNELYNLCNQAQAYKLNCHTVLDFHHNDIVVSRPSFVMGKFNTRQTGSSYRHGYHEPRQPLILTTSYPTVWQKLVNNVCLAISYQFCRQQWLGALREKG